MPPFSWRKWLTQMSGVRCAGKARGIEPRRSSRPSLEGLEDRIVPAPVLDLVKTGGFVITAGSTGTFFLTLTNTGNSPAHQVQVTDQLPSGLTLVDAGTGPVAGKNPDLFTFQDVNGTATFNQPPAGSVPGNNIATPDVFQIVVAAASNLANGSTVIDVGNAQSTDPVSTTGSFTSTITTSADLSVTKSGPAAVTAGSTAVYTLTLSNLGPSDATGVVVTDTVPTGVTVIGTGLSGLNLDNFAGSNTAATASFNGTIVAGHTDLFLVTVSVSPTLTTTPVTDQVKVTATTLDPVVSNNTTFINTPLSVAFDLGVTKNGPTTVTAGNTFTYTLTLTNSGPSNAAGVSLTDSIPSQLIIDGESQLSGADTFSTIVSGNNLTFTANTVAPTPVNNTDIFLVTVTAPSTIATPPVTVTNTASVTPTDSTPADNSSSVTTTILAKADVGIVKTGPVQITAGQTITYALTLSNTGPSAASGVTLTDTVPNNLTAISASYVSGPDSFNFSAPASNVITISVIGQMAAGGQDVVDVVAFAPVNEPNNLTVVNTAQIIAQTTPDLSPGDTISTFSSTIVTSADLSITKTAASGVITAGSTAVYTISLVNNGPSNSQNVSVTDTLPAGLTLVSETAVTNPDNFVDNTANGNVLFNSPVVTAGHTDVFLVTVAAPASSLAGTPELDVANTGSSGTNDPNLNNNSSTFSSAIATSADLFVTKTGPLQITAGTTVTFTLTVGNNGPSNSLNVSVTDVLPGNLTIVSESIGNNPDNFVNNSAGNNILFKAATVGASSADTLFVVASAASTLNNGSPAFDKSTITSATTTDPVAANNTSTLPSFITTASDISVSKSGPSTVTAGSTITYTLTVANKGPSTSTQVTLTDTLPTSLSVITESAVAGNPDAFNAAVVSGNTTVTFVSMNNVATGNTDFFTVVAKVLSGDANGSTIPDTAVGSSTNNVSNPNNTFTLTSTVTTSADLSVTKSGPTPATITAGTSVTYTITLTNNGPSDAQGVTVTDVLPTGTTFSTENIPTNNDGFSFGGSTGGTVTFTSSAVTAGSSDIFTIVAKALPSDAVNSTLSNVVSVASTTSDSNPSNNTFTLADTVTTSADLTLVKTGPSPSTVTAGGLVTYMLTLTNGGPSNAANVSVSDILPANVALIAEGQVGGPDVFTPGPGNNVLFTASSVTVGAGPDVFQVIVKPSSSLPLNSTLKDIAQVTSSTTDPNTSNNSSTITDTVTTAADLSVTKTGPATVTAGATVTYNITLTNNGPSDAQTVTLTDTLPGNLMLVSENIASNADNFTNTSSSTVPSFAAATVGAGHIDVFQVVVSSASGLTNGSSVSDTVSVGSTTTDLAPGNNTASIVSNVTTAADLALSVSGPVAPGEGATFTYSVTLTNTGPSDAQAVSLTDTLPPGLTLVSASFSAGATTSGGGHVTDTIPTLLSGASVTGVVVVTATEQGNFTSTFAVTSGTTDPNPNNNTQALTTSVRELPINLTMGSNLTGTEFSTLNNGIVGTFTHDNGLEPANVFVASIDWGDGTTSLGTVVQSGAIYQVLGTHTFSADASYVVTLTIGEEGASVTATAPLSNAEAPPPVDAPGLPLDGLVNEALDELFRQQPNGSEILTAEQGIFLLEQRLGVAFNAMGASPATASNESWYIAWSQFLFLANEVALFGGSLPSAVNLISGIMQAEAAGV